MKRANQALGTIKSTFTYLEKDIFLPLYKAYIRPQLEYASVIWAPKNMKDILAIEQVQRRATRLIPGMKEMPYEERLKALGLPTLMYRRERADIIQVYKILNRFEEVNFSSAGSLKVINITHTRGHQFKLEKASTRTPYGQHRFKNRVVNPWNNLSEQTVCANSVNSFKSHLNSNWKLKLK